MNLRSKLLVLGCALSIALAAYGLTRMTGVQMVNSTVDSTPIGATTPANITGTVVTATNTFIGNVQGSATSLSPTPSNCGALGTAYGIAANGDALCRTAGAPIIYAGSAAGCDTPNGTYQQCTQTITLNGTFADTNYIPVCVGNGFNHTNGSNGSGILYSTTFTTNSIATITQSNSGNDFYFTKIYCYGMHF